ncbi:MAG: glycerophosphodiester phosphodiesterase [Lachnospiraceae bacterium]|nr:glycerophosphodiester phosphodiesterase [Lachnospiraceae bacterium]
MNCKKALITGMTAAAGIAGLYLAAISPRGRKNRVDRTPFLYKTSSGHERWLYAHRGFHDNDSEAPENSMAAFQRAVEAGYGIELDVQLTKDKVPVVFHDNTLQRVCGVSGCVSDYTYEELQNFPLCASEERIPKFADVLYLINGRVPLIVEYKLETFDTEVCALGNELLSKYQGMYCIESFHPAALRWYKKHRPDIMRGQLSMNFIAEPEYRGKPIYWLMTNMMFNFWTKPDFIAYDHHGADNLSFRISTKLFGALPVAWTIKSGEELQRAKESFQIFIFDSFVPDENN